MTQAFSDPADAANFALFRHAQIEEYGTYVAAADIPVGAVLAFRAGQPVPKSTAEREGWHVTGRVTRTIPPALPGEDRAAVLRARQTALAAEAEAIAAELAETTAGGDGGGLEAMTVDQLKTALAERGMPVSGTKPELIARLRAADTEEA